MSLASILTMLTAILGLYGNPQIAQNAQLKAQVDALAGQAIAAAEQALAQSPTTELGTAVSSSSLSVTVPSSTVSSTPIVVNITPAQPTAPAAPAVVWTPEDKYMVSNQFALDPDARTEWLNGPDGVYNLQTQKVMATSSFQFTIAGRLTQYESSPVPDPKCNCTESWFPMSGVPLTITYGDQGHTATTDADGVAIATFNATGVPGSHPFSYSSPGLNITDGGTVTENPVAPSVGTLTVTPSGSLSEVDIASSSYSKQGLTQDVGDFTLSAVGEGISVYRIEIDLPQSVVTAEETTDSSGATRRLEGFRVMANGAQFGPSEAMPGTSTVVSGAPLTIQAGQSATISILADLVGPASSTISFSASIPADGIVGDGMSSYQQITGPTSAVSGPTIVF